MSLVAMAALPEDVVRPKRARQRQPDSIHDENGHEMLSPPVVAAMTGYTVSTLRTMRHQLRGPSFVKIGARVYYYRDEVEQWLREHRQFFDF